MSDRDAARDDAFAQQSEDAPELAGDQPMHPVAARGDRVGHPRTEPEGEAGMSSARAAMALTRWHPFMAFFLFVADCAAPATMPPHERARAARVEHPWLYRSCVGCDFTLLVLVVVGVLALGVAVACKALGVWPVG